MKQRSALTILVLVAATASAADDAKAPAKPAEPGKAAAPAKERKTTPEAEAALRKYAGLLHFPNSSYETVELNSHCDVPMMGGEVGCKFIVKKGGDVTLDISLPETLREQSGEEQLANIKSGAKSLVGGIFKPFLVPADAMAKQYDLASRVEDGKTIVEMTRFADDAAWDKTTLWFDANGLLEKQKGMPNVDPNNPMASMNAGAEIETTFEYKKRGGLYTIESGKVTEPMGETTLKLAYYEIAGQAPLPKEIVVNSPVFGELTISITDFILNGKPVPDTARKADEKPAAPPAKKDPPAKPAEPAKPAK